MQYLKLIIGSLLLALLVACGGGGGSAGSSSSGGTSTTSPAVTPATVEVLTSSGVLASAGAEAVITAFVKSSANVSLAGQTVSFAASSGILQASSSVTNDNGVVTAKLSAGSNKSIRDITVTVTSGGVKGEIVIPVTGTRLSIAGNVSLQAGGAATQYTVRAVDSTGSPVAGASIKVASTLGNAVSPADLTTDASGSATVLYTPNKAGLDKLTISGLGSTASVDLSVNASDFAVVSPSNNTQVPVGEDQIVTVRYRLGGAGVSGTAVNFSTTRGNVSVANVSTSATGEASIFVSSATAGPAVVTAQIAGVGQVNLPLQFVATTPATIVVQANPGAIAPNSSGAANQSTIEAIVRDAAGNAVANRQVNFTTLQDVSNGTLSPGVATTDLNGRAQVRFIPGANTTPANGVLIQGTVASTSIRSTATLTVNGQALFITIGFGNTMENLNETTYSKPFSVYVTDANGVAVGGQNVTLAVIPREYWKGVMDNKTETTTASGVTAIGKTNWFFVQRATCANEDLNLNGILDPGEDTNVNGQLTPGNVVIAAPGSVTTDATGRAAFNLQYGEQYAGWVNVDVIARASVGGTESRQSLPFILPILVSDIDPGGTPAGVRSPFGITASCTDPN